MNKAIFLDRDGVINKYIPDLSKTEQFEMIPVAPHAVKMINDAGYLAIVATNQPVIAKGFCTFEELSRIHDKMIKGIQTEGGKIDKIYTCPHHPKKGFDGEVPELKIECDCRKPKPGLLLNAARENDIDLKNSWMIGDSYVDIAAGKAAGTKTVLITGGGNISKDEKELHGKIAPDFQASDLADAVKKITGGQS